MDLWNFREQITNLGIVEMLTITEKNKIINLWNVLE
jgi:hypothetical protein